MNAKVIRLDRFSAAPQPAARLTEEDLAASYDHGLEQGLRLAEETGLATLTGQLTQIQSTLSRSNADTSDERQLVLKSIQPVLHVIVSLLAPLGQTERICAALQAELQRQSDEAHSRTCTITCGPDLEQVVRSCLPPNHEHLRIAVSNHLSGGVEVNFSGGLIRLDDAAMVAAITNLIKDIL